MEKRMFGIINRIMGWLQVIYINFFLKIYDIFSKIDHSCHNYVY